jgi:hypothetical protein
MVFEVAILHHPKKLFYCILDAMDQTKAERQALTELFIETGKQALKPVFFARAITTEAQIYLPDVGELDNDLPILGLENHDLTAL